MSLIISEGPKSDLTIATLADETPLYLCGFAAGHLMQGAKKVVVYLDRAGENAFSQLAGQVPGLEIILCDDAFWDGNRPDSVEGRQRRCYSHAYHAVETEWIGLCDADEIFVPKTDFATELANAENEALMIAGPTWEGVWETGSPCEGLYSQQHARRKVSNVGLRRAFFGNTDLFEMLTRDGLVGHVFGKYLVRRAIPKVRTKIHSAFVPDENGELVALQDSKTASVSLLHFDALSFKSWCRKHQRRIDRETVMTGNRTSRVAQTDIYELLTVDSARKSFFEQLYTIHPEKIQKLTGRGLLRPISFEEKVKNAALEMFGKIKEG